MRSSARTTRSTSLWSTVRMESSLNASIRLAQCQKSRLQKFSTRFCRRYSISRRAGWVIGTLNLRTSYSMSIGMWNLLTSALAVSHIWESLERLSVELHPILLLKSSRDRTMTHSWLMFGALESPYMRCWLLSCLLKGRPAINARLILLPVALNKNLSLLDVLRSSSPVFSWRRNTESNCGIFEPVSSV